MNESLKFVVAALATWRVTHLIVYEGGPWDVIARLRRIAGAGFFGKLMDCFYCSSLWVSAAATVLLGVRPKDWVLVWLGLSGAACVLNRIGNEPVVVERLGGAEDGLLRRESEEGADGGNGNASADDA
ncbi:MAG TPA: DUF1360 domain-containing protein, partial [Verrucomicrobiae bacterium]|nr:DUF1360 domain-containing protein [Verrucomicrobiae bacterium]